MDITIIGLLLALVVGEVWILILVGNAPQPASVAPVSITPSVRYPRFDIQASKPERQSFYAALLAAGYVSANSDCKSLAEERYTLTVGVVYDPNEVQQYVQRIEAIPKIAATCGDIRFLGTEI